MAHILAEQDYCVSAFIADSARVLMIQHKKLNCWLPPGGHIELGETTDHAIRREVREETGLIENEHYKFVRTGGFKLPTSMPDVQSGRIEPLNVPWAVERHPFEPVPGHKHLCFLYLCVATPLAFGAEHTSDSGIGAIRWMSVKDLDNLSNEDLWPSVKAYAKESINTVHRIYMP